MIQGTKKDIAKIRPYISEDLQKALDYIAGTDFSRLANGEYKIDGDRIFARVNTYRTAPRDEKRAEAHEAYIDVQYLARGEEAIWYCPRGVGEEVTVPYSPEKDIAFFSDPGEKDAVHMKEGTFAVFFPWELHRPGCTDEKASDVQKIVVKVRAK